MNVLEGLTVIREKVEQLENPPANPETLACIDQIMRRAALPAASSAAANSQLQLVRMLMRTPAANSNIRVYNDFLRIEEDLSAAAEEARERRAAEDARPVPKTKKYYKELKERQKKQHSPTGH